MSKSASDSKVSALAHSSTDIWAGTLSGNLYKWSLSNVKSEMQHPLTTDSKGDAADVEMNEMC
jgi:hypothetical protein